MVETPHNFKSGYTRPFRANCKKCGLTKQNPIHDESFYSCPDCGFEEIRRTDKRCKQCKVVIDWSDVS